MNGFIAISISAFAIAEIIGIHWTWNVAKPLPTYIRAATAILLGPGFILFMKWKKKTVRSLIASVFIFYSVAIVAILMIVTLFFFSPVPPVYTANDYFAPAFKKDQLMLVDTRVTTYRANDFIIFDDPENDIYILAKIEAATETGFLVEHSMGKSEVSEDQIVGAVIQ